MSEDIKANRIEVFVSFANGDKRDLRKREVWKQLTGCLDSLRAEGVIQDWFCRSVDPDAPEATSIERLKGANIIIFAIGQNYLDHPERYREVLKNLPESGRYLVFSLLLYPAVWRNSPFDRFNLLPSNEKPIAEWSNVEDAFGEIKEAIKQARQAIYPDKSKPRPAPTDQTRRIDSKADSHARPQAPESTDSAETSEELPPTFTGPPGSLGVFPDDFPSAFEDTLEHERPKVVVPSSSDEGAAGALVEKPEPPPAPPPPTKKKSTQEEDPKVRRRQ